MRRICFILAATLATALAQKAPPVTPDKGTLDPSISLIGSHAKTVAVSDRYNIAVAGADEGTLQVFGLQTDGTAASAPVQTLTLPLPPEFQSASQAPLCLIFHPVLPLLYVWQDVTTKQTVPLPAGAENIAHLLIYRINGQNLELVGSYVKGGDFAFGVNRGTIALSQNARRLLLPNAYSTKSQGTGLAYCDLTEAGLPVLPAGKTDPEITYLWSSSTLPMGIGIVIGPNGLAIAGSWTAITFMDTDTNLRLRMSLKDQLYYMAGANPKKPVCYFSTNNSFVLVSMELADGYLTQLPRVMSFTGVQFLSPPMVMTARNLIAVGGANQLVLVNLDENGWPLPKAQVIPITGKPLQLAYSEKYNRLYVPVN